MESSERAFRGVSVIEEMLRAEAAERLRDFAKYDRFGSPLATQALEFAFADSCVGRG